MAGRLGEIINRRRLLYAGLAATCCLTLVSLTAAFVEPLRPPGGLEELSEKFAYFDANRDAIDIVIVGSSRVYRGIDPALVERGILDNGCPRATVFNFGLSGMSAPLMAKLTDYIELTATRHHLVLFEPELPLGPEFDFTVTQRARFSNQWSTVVPGVLQLASSFDGSGSSFVKTGILYAKYAASFMRTGLGVGRLRDVILGRDRQAESGDSTSDLWRQAGFYSLDQELSAIAGSDAPNPDGDLSNLVERHSAVVSPSGRAGLIARFHQMEEALRKPVAATVFQRTYMSYLLQRAELRNLTAGFIFMPMSDAAGARREAAMAAYLAKTHSRTMVVDAGLSHLPDLYQPDFWFDYGHLTQAGAARLSRYVGAELCKKMQAE